MARFEIYIERKVSTAVTIEAATYQEALAQLPEYEPGYVAEPEGCDWAGEWEPLTVTDANQREVWTG